MTYRYVIGHWPILICHFEDEGILVEALTGFPAPGPPVGSALQADHAQTVIVRIAARIAHDDDMITGLQGFPRNALAPQLPASAPFNGVANRFAFIVLTFDVDERMRIAEQELNQVALDG